VYERPAPVASARLAAGMAARVGIDLVCVAEVAASIERLADRYLSRVCTPRELADCTTSSGVSAARVAGRFAAKEATLKVLAPGPGTAIPWRSIEVRGDREVVLGGAAAERAASAGVGELRLSLSAHRGHAIAIVTAEETPIRRQGVL
jgi:holo-[acyl-carrier protein] synthase